MVASVQQVSRPEARRAGQTAEPARSEPQDLTCSDPGNRREAARSEWNIA
jgi:hypothetical protein